MIYTRTRALMLASLTSFALLAGCGGNESNNDKPAAPTGFTVTPGDGRVTVEWDGLDGLNYWLFKAQGIGLVRSNYRGGGNPSITAPVFTPFVVTGLVNGLPYSFFLNASKGDGPAGDETATSTVIPRLAGDAWTAPVDIDPDNDSPFAGVTYLVNRFVAVGANGAIFYTSDTKKWLPVTTSDTSADLTAVAATSTMAVAVGEGGSIVYTTDGLTWTAATVTDDPKVKLNSVVYGPDGYFVAVGDAGTVLRSLDGVNWAALAADKKPASLGNLNSVKSVNGLLIFVGDSGTLLASTSSADLSSSKVDISGVTSENLYGAAYGAGVYLVVGSNATILASTDLTTWTRQTNLLGLDILGKNLNSIGLGSRFMAVGQDGAAIIGVVSGSASPNELLNWSKPTGGPRNELPSTQTKVAMSASSAGFLTLTADGKSESVF